MNISMEFIPFCPDVMKMRILSIFKIKFQRKRRKQPKNEIRPANCKIDGLAKLFVRGAVKNLNPRKGTETFAFSAILTFLVVLLRTLIPVRGRKRVKLAVDPVSSLDVKKLNPQKGTETWYTYQCSYLQLFSVKNHNPRKGTETC